MNELIFYCAGDSKALIYTAAFLSDDEHSVSLAVSCQVVEIERLSFDEEGADESVVFLQLAVLGVNYFERVM